MSIEPPAPVEGPKALSRFERFLTVWVALCIVAGVGLGHVFPVAFKAIGSAEVARVNLPVAVLIWVMIYPMMVQIDFSSLLRLKGQARGLSLTVVVTAGPLAFNQKPCELWMIPFAPFVPTAPFQLALLPVAGS